MLEKEQTFIIISFIQNRHSEYTMFPVYLYCIRFQNNYFLFDIFFKKLNLTEKSKKLSKKNGI